MKPGVDFIGVSTAFYCHDGKDFLLHKRSENCRDEIGFWDVGGGQLEFGESLGEGVLREVKEEYGVKGIIEKQLHAYSLVRKNNNNTKTHWIIISFLVKVPKGKVKNNNPIKISEMGWFKLNNLPKPLHQGPKYLLKHYPDEFKKYL